MGLGKTYSTKYLLDSNNNSGVAGQVLSTTSTGIDWVDANTVPGTGLWLENGNDIYNSNSGNVGIGTTAPTTKLYVYNGEATIASATDGVKLSYSNGNSSGIIDTAFSDNNLEFRTNGTAKMWIANGGNVGIGTTNPSAKFVVADGMSGTNSQTGLEFIPQDSNNRNIIFSYDRSSGAYRELNFDASDFRFNPGGSTKMVISSSGNVGIGTTSPTNYKLEVNGNVKGNSFGTDENTTARIFAPSGAAYNGSGTQTGYLIMQLPDNGAGGVNNMMSGVIRVFDYTFGESFDVHFAGYWYSGYNWTNCTAFVINEPGVERNFPVRFGAFTGSAGANTRPYIAIGDTASTWNYCKFSVTEYTSGHSNMNLYKWNSGWAASLSATLPGAALITVTNTQTNNWKRSNNDMYSGNSGNVGIGTTSPGANLDVAGAAPVIRITNTTDPLGNGTVGSFEFFTNDSSTGATRTVSSIVCDNQAGSAVPGGELVFKTSLGGSGSPIATEKMRIDMDGNVGIGNTSPDFRLHTNLNLSGTPLAYLNGTSNTFDATLNLGVTHNSTAVGTGTAAGVYLANNANNDGAPSPIIAFSALSAGGSYNHTYAAIYGIKTAGGADTNWVKGDLTFATGNTTGPERRMTILANGNVGIGTVSPGYKLQVGDTGVGDGNIAMKANGSGADAGAKLTFNMDVGGGNANSYIAQIVPISYDSLSSGTHNSLNFKVGTWNNNADAGVSRMTILSNGNIGIGTTDPGSFRLNVNGDSTAGILSVKNAANGRDTFRSENAAGTRTVNIGNDGSGHGNVLIRNSAGTTTNYISGSGNSYFNGGNVGIGTTSPGAKLEISKSQDTTFIITSSYNGSWATQNYGHIEFKSEDLSGTTDPRAAITGLQFSNGAYGGLGFSTHGLSGSLVEAMRIDQAGNVGIGTTTPDAKLDVSDSIPVLRITGTRNASWTIGQTMASLEYFSEDASGSSANSVRASINLVNETSVYGSTTGLSFSTKGDVVGSPIEAMRINSSGNVGIGTTSPGTKLQVGTGSGATVDTAYQIVADGSAISGIQILSGATQSGRLVFGDSGNNDIGIIKYDHSNNSLQTIVNAAERMRIDASGNVGIGVTSIPSWANLITSGTVAVGGRLYIKSNNSIQGLSGFPGSSDKLIINPDGGNVGVGTTSPTAKLHVIGQDATFYSNTGDQSLQVGRNANERLELYVNDNMGKITVIQDSDNNGPHNFILNRIFAGTGSNDFLIQKDGSTQLVINTNGNVGIGTTSPGYKLEVSDANTYVGIKNTLAGSTASPSWSGLTFAQSSGAVGASIQSGDQLNSNSNNDLRFLTRATGGGSASEIVRFTGGGNVGIGTDSPTEISSGATTLEISGTVTTKSGALRLASSDNSLSSYFYHQSSGLLMGTATAQPIRIITNNSEKIRIESAGNVGIGTTSPGSKLQVAGEIRVADGAKGAPSYSFTSDTNTGMFSDTADVLEFTVGGDTNLQIRSGYLDITRYIRHIGDADTYFGFTAANQFQVIAGGNTNLNVQGNGVDLSYAGSTRLTTQTGGIAITGDLTVTAEVGIGLTNPDVPLHVTANEDGSGIDKGAAKFINTNTGQGATTMHMVQTSSSNFANAVKFWQGSTPTAVGFIRLTTSATQFITSASDLNLKKNITNWSDDTLSKFKALEPKKFRFKTQDVSEDKTLGFIAQNEVDNFPEAYPQFLGDDEQPYYGFNPTGMVPHLMKAIKDLVEKVEILENKITQLENNN